MKSKNNKESFIKKIFCLLMAILISFSFSTNSFANHVDQYIADQVAWDNKEVAANISDTLMVGMIGLPYVFTLKGEDKLEKTATAFFVQGFNWLLTDNVKMRVKRVRPNQKNDRSFFSGHTSSSFVSAGLMCAMKEYCTESLVAAGLTGYLRMAANMHWASDVIVGAAIGYAQGRYIPTVFISY